MKILLSLVLTLLILSGCKVAQFSVGMSEEDFRKKNRGIEVVYQTLDETVYRKINYALGKPTEEMFFSFKNGLLVRYTKGKRPPDIIIEKRQG